MIQEHSIKLDLDLPTKVVNREMDVFYNPVMVSNRNIAILLLNSIENMQMNIVDPLAGSGIRSLRFLKELSKGKINHLFVNDLKDNFESILKNTAKKNKVNLKNVTMGQEEASAFLMNRVNDTTKPKDFCGYFDYIEIDPFGTPNPFLSAAVARITRNGILAVTATDTAALAGTYPRVTERKYWATSLKNYLMHELGVRILIRKVQVQGVQFDKALIPILSYSKDHYFRIYFRSQKGKEKCDELLKQHQYFLFCNKCYNFKISTFNKEKCGCKNTFTFAGPMWVDKLFDSALLEKMAHNNPYSEEQKFLDTLYEESKQEWVGFYDMHQLARLHKTEVPKMEIVLKKVKGVRTHFSLTGIKSNKNVKDFVKLLK